jgi:hypothetical protein
MLLHCAEKFGDDFRAGPNQSLSFASLLGIVDGLEGIV